MTQRTEPKRYISPEEFGRALKEKLQANPGLEEVLRQAALRGPLRRDDTQPTAS